MQSICNNLMAALLLIHTALGCCGHHAQDCWECEALAVPVTEPAHCCHHHNDDEDGHLPRQCCLNCPGDCNYLAPQKVQVHRDQHSTPLDFADIASAITSLDLAAAARWKNAGSYDEPGPPLRTHLMHQVLLI